MVPIVQAYAYSKYLGHLEVSFDDAGEVPLCRGQHHASRRERDAGRDQSLPRVAELAGPIEEMMVEVVGETTEVGRGRPQRLPRDGMPRWGNLVADAMLDRVADQGIQIAIANGGGLRASIRRGRGHDGRGLHRPAVPEHAGHLPADRRGRAGRAQRTASARSKRARAASRRSRASASLWDPAAEPGSRRGVGRGRHGRHLGGARPPKRTYGGGGPNNFMRNGGGTGYSVFARDAMNAYDFGPRPPKRWRPPSSAPTAPTRPTPTAGFPPRK